MLRSKLSKKVLLNFGGGEGEGEGVLRSPYNIIGTEDEHALKHTTYEITTFRVQNLSDAVFASFFIYKLAIKNGKFEFEV